jgi:hypothetical protein
MVLDLLLLGTGAVGVFCLVFQLLFKYGLIYCDVLFTGTLIFFYCLRMRNIKLFAVTF